MLTIDENGYTSPDGTYFRNDAAQPELVEVDGVQVLKLVNGVGSSRSWGCPGVTSTVVLSTDDLVAVHIGFHHKHGGGQFWRYYTAGEQGVWKRVEWKDLPDETRERVLIAGEDRAPDWAKEPGKLRKNYARPNYPVYTTYKLIQVVDNRYYSVYNSDVEYVLGRRLAEKAVDAHGGGYYSYPSASEMLDLFYQKKLFPLSCYDDSMTLALLECEISGTVINYGKKCASTYLRPVAVLDTFAYVQDAQEAM